MTGQQHVQENSGSVGGDHGQHVCMLVFVPVANILNIPCDYQFVSVVDMFFMHVLKFSSCFWRCKNYFKNQTSFSKVMYCCFFVKQIPRVPNLTTH